MRIQTLIVKGIIAVACLLIPSEVLAAGNGKSDDHPEPPVQKLDLPATAENSGNGNTDQGDSSDHGQNQKDEHANANAIKEHGVNVNVNAEVHSQKSKGEEKRSLHVDVNNGKSSIHAKVDVNRQHGKVMSDKVGKSTDSLEKGAAVHSDHSQNGQQKKDSDQSINFDDRNRSDTDQKPKAERDTDDLKSSTDEMNQRKGPKPIPTDSHNTPQPTPVVIPAQHVLNVSKSSGQNGDGQSTTSGSGFTFYGIASFGDGPLITLVNDYSNELKRKNNQWINAPPSPPPKSNLLSH